MLAVLQDAADRAGTSLAARGRDWSIERVGRGLRYAAAAGALDLPLPALPGAHQYDNAGIAIAALRAAGFAAAEWPARLQRLDGRLAALLPGDWELWLDGGHNEGAGVALGEHLAGWRDRPMHLVVGMKQTKDPTAFLRPLLPHAASVWAVAEPG